MLPQLTIVDETFGYLMESAPAIAQNGIIVILGVAYMRNRIGHPTTAKRRLPAGLVCLCLAVGGALTASPAALAGNMLYEYTETFTLSSTRFNAGQFTNWTLSGGVDSEGFQLKELPEDAILKSVSVNAILNSRDSTSTFAKYLAVIVQPTAPTLGGAQFQAGGSLVYAPLNQGRRFEWGGDGNSTTVIGTTPDSQGLGILLADTNVWVGNGGLVTASGFGVWTGTMTITYLSAVPEPSSLALGALASAGLGVVITRRRWRARQQSR